MKIKIGLFMAALLIASPGASAALSYSWNAPQTIPDNSISGAAFGFTITDPATSITDVSVTLNISGGWNGDSYAYLSHGSGFAVLLNRLGVGANTPGSSADGYGDAGLAIRLSSAGAANVHFYGNQNPTFSGGQLTGTWQPDGRAIAPNSTAAGFDASGTANFGTFQNLDPNGQWTLFFMDASPLGISTLNDFSVNITAVPEPASVALGVFAAAFLAVQGCRLAKRRWVRSGRQSPLPWWTTPFQRASMLCTTRIQKPMPEHEGDRTALP